MSNNGRISGRITALGYGAIVASGPWLITMAGLGAIALLSRGNIPENAVVEFRAFIVNGFLLAFICSMPVTIVGTRLIADALFAKKLHSIPAVFLSTLLLAPALTIAASLVLYLGFYRVPIEWAVPGIVSGAMMAEVWVAASFSSATRAYLVISAAFLIGMIVSVVATLVDGIIFASVDSMIWGYCAGLGLILAILVFRFLATFPFPVYRIHQMFRLIGAGFRSYRQLALAGLIGAVAVWADKFVVWFMLPTERTAALLIHFPLYDNPMFTAYLVNIPALALFVVHLETVVSKVMVTFQRSLLNHANLQTIDQLASKLRTDTLAAFHRIVLFQFSFCVLLVVFAPDILVGLGFQARQVVIFQFGAMGALFHFVFFACSTIILYLDLRGHYLWLQVFFLATTTFFTVVTILAGPQYLGFGYMVAATMSGVLSYVVMVAALEKVAYHAFITSIFTQRMAV